MGSLGPCVMGLSTLLRATDGWTFFGSNRCDRVVFNVTGRGQEHQLSGGTVQTVVADAQAWKPNRRRFHGDAQAIIALNQVTASRTGDKVFEVEMQVHDDDIDQYGAVNNAVYATYINRARDVLTEYLGIGVEYWEATGDVMATSELNLKYFAPLRSGDKFVVKMWPEKIKGVRLVVRHLIETLPDGKLVLDSRATIVFLDKDYRPTRVFPQVAAKLGKIFGCKTG